MKSTNSHECPGCGSLLPPTDGPTHDYMHSSPACWAAFGQVLAREYSTASLLPVHRMSVDTYAIQHPGGHSRQAIQSVGVHLARLCLFIDHGLSSEAANSAMLVIGKIKSQMEYLDRPIHLGNVTVVDVVSSRSEEAHRDAVRRWSQCAWESWEDHHETVRMWIDASKHEHRR